MTSHPARARQTSTDVDLLAAIGGGDSDALGELMGRHHRELWVIAYRYVRRDHLADDVLAVVMAQVWRKAAQFRGQSQPRTWLVRVTVNAAIDALRHERTRPDATAATTERLTETVGPTAGDVAAGVADRDFVTRLLGELPAAQRRAVELVDVAGHSVADAAAVLGCAEGTVKSRRSRALRALADRWTFDGERRRVPRTPAPAATPPPDRPGRDRVEPEGT